MEGPHWGFVRGTKRTVTRMKKSSILQYECKFWWRLFPSIPALAGCHDVIPRFILARLERHRSRILDVLELCSHPIDTGSV